jgi:hypothetical protein
VEATSLVPVLLTLLYCGAFVGLLSRIEVLLLISSTAFWFFLLFAMWTGWSVPSIVSMFGAPAVLHLGFLVGVTFRPPSLLPAASLDLELEEDCWRINFLTRECHLADTAGKDDLAATDTVGHLDISPQHWTRWTEAAVALESCNSPFRPELSECRRNPTREMLQRAASTARKAQYATTGDRRLIANALATEIEHAIMRDGSASPSAPKP